jgi:hypothetical protein
MRITVRTLQGVHIGPIDMPVDKTIANLKQEIHDRENINIDDMRIIYTQRELDNVRTMQDYNLPDPCELWLVLRW